MKSSAKDEKRSRTKERLREPMADPTLEGKDENKVGRVQEKIGPGRVSRDLPESGRAR